MREEEDGVRSFSNVLMLSDDVFNSGDGGEDRFGFGITGKDCPQILCFGGRNQNDADLLFPELSDSTASPLSSRCNTCTVHDNKSSNSNKRTGSGDGHDRVCDPKPGKRCKRDQKKKSSVGNAKVRKEKIGGKITALQHLVSPYGKTDTASVLHETMGYIKFLEEQVKVLSSPYFKHNPPLTLDDEDVNPTLKVKELKSNGLCLVPLSWTLHVADTNGADLWSPAAISSPTV